MGERKLTTPDVIVTEHISENKVGAAGATLPQKASLRWQWHLVLVTVALMTCVLAQGVTCAVKT